MKRGVFTAQCVARKDVSERRHPLKLYGCAIGEEFLRPAERGRAVYSEPVTIGDGIGEPCSARHAGLRAARRGEKSRERSLRSRTRAADGTTGDRARELMRRKPGARADQPRPV